MLQKRVDLYNQKRRALNQFNAAMKETTAMVATLKLHSIHLDESVNKAFIYGKRIIASQYALLKLTSRKNGIESCSNCNHEMRGLRDDLRGSIESLRIVSRDMLLSAENMENVARLCISLSADLAEAAAASNNNYMY